MRLLCACRGSVVVFDSIRSCVDTLSNVVEPRFVPFSRMTGIYLLQMNKNSSRCYSYASTSRTVRRVAFHAGRKLASAASSSTSASQSRIPATEKV